MEPEICQAALSALEKAIGIEAEGHRFYSQALALASDEGAQRVFQALIADEELHERVLKAEYEAIAKEGEWMLLDEAKTCEPPSGTEVVFPAGNDAMAALLRLTDGATDEDVLGIAMEFEQRGYDLYKKAAQETDDPKGKEVYEWLAEDENSHYLFLSKTQEYLITKGAWYFDEIERPMFEG